MENPFAGLQPASAWEMFALICSIPHPSRHEKALAERIAALAREHGLKAVVDKANCVRIDRPASPGFEKAPLVILQGHIDMVPAARPGLDFDFTKEAVKPVVRDGFVYASGTTLGSDNGAGSAIALSMLLDPDLKAGPMAGLFTSGEEIGLIGASQLKPEMLRGDWLLNLDCGPDTAFCIGCAGGARLEFDYNIKQVTCPQGNPYKITLGGLAGGHSGGTIHEHRGNALILLARFLRILNPNAVFSFEGGVADNAIPSFATANIVSSAGLEPLQRAAELFIRETEHEFNAPPEYAITIDPCEKPETVWDNAFAQQFLMLVQTVPNEVFARDERLGIVKTSSNFATCKMVDGVLKVRTSQRSLVDADRVKTTEQIRQHFAPLNGTISITGVYPGWPADPESEPVRVASAVYEKLFGAKPLIHAIHAGLETGLFAGKNPHLKILSHGPAEKDIHTPLEALNIASFEKTAKFVRAFLEETARSAGK